jgi:hypothetical protein
MTPKCRICDHSRRAEIDAALLAGDGVRVIAKRVGESKSTIHWHTKHIAGLLAKRPDVKEQAHSDRLFAELKRLTAEAERLKAAAEREGDIRTALMAVRELCRICELMARINGAIADASINVTNVSLAVDRATADRIVRGYLASGEPAMLPEAVTDVQLDEAVIDVGQPE